MIMQLKKSLLNLLSYTIKKSLSITIVMAKFVVSVSLILILNFSVYAAPAPISSSMPEPVPYLIDNGDGTKTINLFAFVQDSRGSRLYNLVSTVPSSYSFLFYQRNVNYWILTCDNSFRVDILIYDLISGGLLEGYHIDSAQNSSIQPDSIHTYFCGFRVGYFPKEDVYSDNFGFLGAYYMIPDNLDKRINNNTGYFDGWITWSILPPDPIVYRSYMSMPIWDNNNSYLVVGNGSDAKLYWFSLISFEYQFINNDKYNYISSDVWAKSLTINGNNISFNIINSAPSALNDLAYVAYVLMVSSYDLSSGQFISSTYYAADDTTTINIDITSFISLNDAIDIYVTGMAVYISNHMLNRSSIIWSADPSFETWRNSILLYLDSIYNILNQNAEDVTIDQDQSALDRFAEAASDLYITNQDGQNIDAADAASQAFESAAAGVSELAAPISTINNEITDNLFTEPILLVPIIVSLALGLMITILGRNKSD